jgi:hypothetical protein
VAWKDGVLAESGAFARGLKMGGMSAELGDPPIRLTSGSSKHRKQHDLCGYDWCRLVDYVPVEERGFASEYGMVLDWELVAFWERILE